MNNFFNERGGRFGVSDATAMNVVENVFSAFLQDRKLLIRWQKRDRLVTIGAGFRAFQDTNYT